MELKQSKVVFNAKEHTYMLGTKELKGVTPIVHWLYPETYANIPESIMMQAAEYGSMIHSAIQMSDVVGITEHESVKAYQRLKKEHGLTTIANEFLVSDEETIASSIDVVCTEDGAKGDALIDVKTTSKVLHHHLAVQLSIYAFLYERQTGRRVGNLYCMWLPKERYGNPALIPVKRIPNLPTSLIIKDYLEGKDNTASREFLQENGYSVDIENTSEELPAQYADVVDEIIAIEEQLKAMKERDKALKEGMLELMRSAGVKKWQSDRLTMTYVAETTRKAVDSTKLKKEFPDVYAACMKESKVSDSIKITINS